LLPIFLSFSKIIEPTCSIDEGHQNALTKLKENESQQREVVCGICQASASSPASLLESCLSKQKATIFGPNRDHSCDSCDVHLSEKEWLENHKKGEKHRWVTERVNLLLPVQWIQPPPKTVLRGANVPPELVCVVCQQGFWPLDKYRKHLGSLYHLKQCAGDLVE